MIKNTKETGVDVGTPERQKTCLLRLKNKRNCHHIITENSFVKKKNARGWTVLKNFNLCWMPPHQ